MTTTYNRVTSIGFNTGKIIIGSSYFPKARKMYPDEYVIQELLLSKRTPSKRVFRSVAQRSAAWVYRCITQIIKLAQDARK